MRLWLLALGAGLSAGSAIAAGPPPNSFEAPHEQHAPLRSFNLRLVEQPPTDPSPVHSSGMIAETGVAGQVRVGVGLFSARRNTLNPFEPKSDLRTRPSRKVRVSLRWRF